MIRMWDGTLVLTRQLVGTIPRTGSINGMLLTIMRPPSITIHSMCMGILTTFGYKDKY